MDASYVYFYVTALTGRKIELDPTCYKPNNSFDTLERFKLDWNRLDLSKCSHFQEGKGVQL